MKAFVLLLICAVLSLACGGKVEKAFLSDSPSVAYDPPVVDPVPVSAGCQFPEDCIAQATEAGGADQCAVYNCVNGVCEAQVVECDAGQVCVLGECVYESSNCDDVDDNNSCTLDSCDELAGEAVHTAKNCDDGINNTADVCNPADGSCQHSDRCGNCSDEDPCTLDSCDPFTLECVHNPLLCGQGLKCVPVTIQIAGSITKSSQCVKFCTQHADCADNDLCTIHACDLEIGVCKNKEVDCDDSDPTTVDICVELEDWVSPPWFCDNVPTACTGGCDDDNPCTDDWCTTDGQCLNQPLECGYGTVCSKGDGDAQCIPDPKKCTADSQCNDGNSCTEDQCEYGVCSHLFVICPKGSLCENLTGTCLLLDECPKGCPKGEECQDGNCMPVTPVTCGAGTKLNPDTNQCEVVEQDPSCVEDTEQCMQFQGTGQLVYATCTNGNWFVVESCGPIGGVGCLNGVGCK